MTTMPAHRREPGQPQPSQPAQPDSWFTPADPPAELPRRRDTDQDQPFGYPGETFTAPSSGAYTFGGANQLPPPLSGFDAGPAQFLGRSAPPAPKRRRRRVFTWVIVGINALFLVLMIVALTSGGDAAEKTCAGQTFDEVFTKQDCLDAANVGAGVGSAVLFFGILFVWALVDVILGVIWTVTRRRPA